MATGTNRLPSLAVGQFATKGDLLEAGRALNDRAKSFVRGELEKLETSLDLRLSKKMELQAEQTLQAELDKRLAELEEDYRQKSADLAEQRASLERAYETKSLHDGAMLTKRLGEADAVLGKRLDDMTVHLKSREQSLEQSYRDRVSSLDRDYDQRTALLQAFQENLADGVKSQIAVLKDTMAACVKELALALSAVHFPTPVVNVGSPTVNVEAPVVNVAERLAPVVNNSVTVPELALDAVRALLENFKLPAPVVNNTVEAAKPRSVTKSIKYDDFNRPVHIFEQEANE